MLVNTLYGPEEVESKLCSKCGEEKPLSEFTFREPKVGKSYRTECKQCANEKNNLRLKLIKENPKSVDPNYSCLICNKTEEELKNNNKWNDRSVWTLDHDHTDSTFRGWICNNCNIGLGRFDDDTELLQKAILYIEQHKRKKNG